MLVINGQQQETPFPSKSWMDDPAFRLVSRQRSDRHDPWVHGITIHTTQGKDPQPILPGLGTAGGALANIRYWNGSPNFASAHLLVDKDGTVIQAADLASEVTWHATSVNSHTIGIEVVQGSDGSLYQGQIDTLIKLVDWLTDKFRIQRQIPAPYQGRPLERLSSGGSDFVGVYGHRDQTSNRGRGDPGDTIMDALHNAGYERYDLNAGEDKQVWMDRQRQLGISDPDGVPGPSTVEALKRSGRTSGLWVLRGGASITTGSAMAANQNTVIIAVLIIALGVGTVAWSALEPKNP